MAAFRINAINPSTQANDWHYLGHATERTGASQVLFEVGTGPSIGSNGPLMIRGNKDVMVGNYADPGTTMTGGFLYIPSIAGAPTGVPANAAAGWVPLIYDRTNNKFYIYDAGWVGVTLS